MVEDVTALQFSRKTSSNFTQFPISFTTPEQFNIASPFGNNSTQVYRSQSGTSTPINTTSAIDRTH